jgi:hypothetical protein
MRHSKLYGLLIFLQNGSSSNTFYINIFFSVCFVICDLTNFSKFFYPTIMLSIFSVSYNKSVCLSFSSLVISNGAILPLS